MELRERISCQNMAERIALRVVARAGHVCYNEKTNSIPTEERNMNFWETVKGWIGNDVFSIFVYIAILALFLIGVFKCILPVVHTRDVLRRAVKNIKKGDKARRSWQEDRFLGKGVLMPHWSDYLNNLFFADNEYHNPANVEDYINEETVISGPGRAQLAEALPGVQVSLGFLGTLLGLSLALSGMGADVSDVAGSMSTLLGSMRYAFLTSIVGVVASVTFTLITRAVQGSAQRELLNFYNAMARCAGVLSVDPMTQIAIYQQEQTALMKKLLEAVSPENFANRVSEAVSPLAKAVCDSMNMVSNEQSKLMDQVAEAYIRRVNDALHGQLDHLSATIDDTCRHQEKALSGVSDALSAFEDVRRAANDIREVSAALLRQYEDALARISQAQARGEETADRLSSAAEIQAESMQALAGLNDEFIRQADVLRQSAREFAVEADRRNLQNAEAMQDAARRMGEAGAALTGAIADARKKLTRDMNESLDYFEGCMTEILKRIEWAANSVNDSVSALPDAVQATSGRYLEEIGLLTEALEASRRRLSRAEDTEEANESK